MKEGSIDLRGLALVVVAGSWLVGILCGSLVELPALLLLICAGLLLLCTVLVWHYQWARLLLCFTLCLLLGAWRYSC